MLEIEQLAPALGAHVRGINLAEPLEDDVVSSLRGLFAERSLLLFRDQVLSAEDQRRFVSTLGPLSTDLLPEEDLTHGKSAFFLSNEYADGRGELVPHSDHCFTDRPLWGISLYAHAVPTCGGDTVFTSAVAACRNLPDALSRSLTGRTAVHAYRVRERLGDDVRDQSLPDTLSAVHPVVWSHPVTGAPVLYVNPWMTRSIVDMEPEASDALIRELMSYQTDPSITYRHRWRKDDLLVWDNIALLHARTTYDESESRLLYRLQLGLPEPDDG